ncbi:MAG: hypothetical protein LBH15_00300 [Treponema sp.]|nr:hypothetical protein [Treponema sp.]
MRYYIKCEKGRTEFLDILRETGGGYHIRITRIKDDNKKTIEEFLPKQLFDICLSTGYIKQETISEKLSA